MSAPTTTIVRAASILAGAAAGALLVLAGQVPQSASRLGAGLELRPGRSAELAVSPAGRPLVEGDLQPGGGASGRVSMWNPTEAALAVRPRLTGSERDLDRAVRVFVRAGGRPVFRGPLGDLRRRALEFRIAPGGRETLALRAWVPASAAHYEGRVARVRLDLATRIAES